MPPKSTVSFDKHSLSKRPIRLNKSTKRNPEMMHCYPFISWSGVIQQKQHGYIHLTWKNTIIHQQFARVPFILRCATEEQLVLYLYIRRTPFHVKSNKRLENKPKGYVFYNNVMCVHHTRIWSRSAWCWRPVIPLRTWCVLGDEVKRCQCWFLYYNHNFGKQNKNKNKRRKGGGLMTPRMVFLSFSFFRVCCAYCDAVVF
jgi:hypothetical protein